MKGEIHLIIVWKNAFSKLNEIIEDLTRHFIIKNVYEITWNKERFSENLTRFYGQNLPVGCDKETHVGNGSFHAIVFQDREPEYEIRDTTKGDVEVNIRIFDRKQKYREWTDGGHKIHATNSPEESLHDIWLLLGRDSNEFFAVDSWNNSVEAISIDVIGADGWQSIEQFFSTLNRTCKYIVLRNFEPLPDQYHLEDHGDIDLLVDDLANCIYISNGTKAFDGEHRVHYYVKIAGELIPFDFRYIGDSYYDKNFEISLLDNREFQCDCFYAPARKDYFYSLLYHALIHKIKFSADYIRRLIALANEVDINFDGTPACASRLLAAYFYQNDYRYVRPLDSTVIYNEQWAWPFNNWLESDSAIAEVIANAEDLSTLSLEIRRNCKDWVSTYHMSGMRANILRPFEADLSGSVLEIGAGCGAITRYLGECGGKVLSLEPSPRRAAIASSRTRDLKNVCIVTENLDEFKSAQQFDVITLIGGIEAACVFISGDTPAVSLLQRIKAMLKPDGKFILAVENQFGLKYFAGAVEDFTGRAMYGIEGRNKAGQPDVFGKRALEQLLNTAGFNALEIMAPFPDYKLPVSILTEQGIAHNVFDASAFASQSVLSDPLYPVLPNFSIEQAWSQVFNNGLVMEMANSILFIASPTQQSQPENSLLAYHFSTQRLAKFCKETVFETKDSVNVNVKYRRLADSDSKDVVNEIGKLDYHLPDAADYIIGKPLSNELISVISYPDWTLDEIGSFASKYLAAIINRAKKSGINISHVMGDIVLPGNFMDMLPQNIMIKPDGELEEFDLEWVCTSGLKLEYLLFRGLFVTLGSVSSAAMPLDRQLLEWKYFIQQALAICGVTVSDEKYASFLLKEIDFRTQATGVQSGTLNVLLSYKLPTVFSKAEKDNAVTERDRLRAELATGVITINQMKNSLSWRITRPLRFAKRLYHYGLLDEDKLRIMNQLRNRYHNLPLPAFVKKSISFIYHRMYGRVIRLLRRSLFMLSGFNAPKLKPSIQKPGLHDYIVWGVVDWHFRHQRPQQLSQALAKTGRRVFYISPNIIDDTRSGFEMEALDKEGLVFQINLFSKGAPAIYLGAPGMDTITQLRASIGEVLDWAECKQIISLVQHPYWYDFASVLPNSHLVYDCMDHHGGFDNTGESLLQLEKILFNQSDLTITTSSWLDNAVAEHVQRSALIRNAGEYAHFCTEPEKIYKDPQGRKIIGYYGAIAEWFDLALVELVARHNPECSVLLIGADTCNAVQTLGKQSNITFIGEVAYDQLPFYLYSFDVCLLPFNVIPLTLATNPVKVYEYLSAGKPVVSVDLPEMKQFDGLVHVATDYPGFLAAIDKVLASSEPVELLQQRRDFAAGQTWDHRTQAIIEQVESSAFDASASVVVVTYNNIDLTKACLTSIDEQTQYSNVEIIVVDNASSDGSPEYLQQWVVNGNNRKLILNDDNKGFAAANNQGLNIATGEFLVMLNNDTYVTPGWLHTLIRHLKRDESLGLIGPVTNNIGNEAKIDIQYADMNEMLIKSAAYTRRHIGQVYPLRTAAFFCVMLRKSIFENVGQLDEEFGRGFFEDDDYCRRIEQIGLRIACAEDVFVHHNLSASFNKLGDRKKKELFDANKIVYEKKWGEWLPHNQR